MAARVINCLDKRNPGICAEGPSCESSCRTTKSRISPVPWSPTFLCISGCSGHEHLSYQRLHCKARVRPGIQFRLLIEQEACVSILEFMALLLRAAGWWSLSALVALVDHHCVSNVFLWSFLWSWSHSLLWLLLVSLYWYNDYSYCHSHYFYSYYHCGNHHYLPLQIHTYFHLYCRHQYLLMKCSSHFQLKKTNRKWG